jgi:MarR family 2-MHQ and catechol resistance regulon transcriptional repressor
MAKLTASAPAAPSPDANALDRAAALKLFVVMARAFRSVAAPLRTQLKRWDLSPSEFGVLEALYHKGPLPLTELADRILVTGASMTYTVKKLEERGLIARRCSEEDLRFVFAELTAAGRELIIEVFPEHAELIRVSMRGLSRQEKRDTAELLKRLGLAAGSSEE